MNYYFDNAKTTLDLKEVQKFQVYLKKSSLSKARENVTQVVKSIDMKQTFSQTKYLFLRPLVRNPNMITMGEMQQKTIESFKEIYNTLRYARGKYLIVYWSFVMLLTFGFWDTFASTFLIDFLDQVKK